MLPALFRRQLRLIITMDGIIHITIEAITTHITTEGITTHIAIAGTTIGTGPGLSGSTGVQGIIAIGKRVLCAPPLPFSKSTGSARAHGHRVPLPPAIPMKVLFDFSNFLCCDAISKSAGKSNKNVPT